MLSRKQKEKLAEQEAEEKQARLASVDGVLRVALIQYLTEGKTLDDLYARIRELKEEQEEGT